MHPTHPASKLAALVLIALTAPACRRPPTLEEMPLGTAVTIEMQDGRHVAGTLVSVEPETVVVNGVRGDAKVHVRRTNVAEVLSGVDAAGRPALREAMVPRGSMLSVRLDTDVASNTSRVEEPVEATLTAPFEADGVTIAPAGSRLLGSVTTARESGRVRGRAEVGLRFNRLRTDAVTYDISTAPIRWVAEAIKSEDAAKVGIGAAAGAVIGAGGGSAVVLATKGEEIRIALGTSLRVELTEPLGVMAPADED